MKRILLSMMLCFVAALGAFAEVVMTTEDGDKTLVLTQTDNQGTSIGTYITNNLATLQAGNYDKVVINGNYGNDFTPLDNLGVPYIDLTNATNAYNGLSGEMNVTNANIKGIVVSVVNNALPTFNRVNSVEDLVVYVKGDHYYTYNNVYANHPDEATAYITNDNTLVGFFEAFPNASFKKLEVNGTIRANDLGQLKAETVDLSACTMNGTIDDIKGTEKYLMLPNDVVKETTEDGKTTGNATLLSSISKNNNPNLKVVGSVAEAEQEEWIYTPVGTSDPVTTQTKDRKILSLYQIEQNNVAGFVSAFGLGNTAFDKLCMAGLYGENDLAVKANEWSDTRNAIFNKTDLHYFDFTGATFDEDVTVNLESGTYGTYAQESETCTTTNALYYLNNYNVMTCVLPTGNTKIPPRTFYTENGGWNSPLAEIIIPEGYTEIGFEAFYASHISSLVLPSTIEHVGVGAFHAYGEGSGFLVDVDMQPNTAANGCTFGAAAFMYQDKLKHVSLSEGVKNISGNMFDQCWQLESIRIPNTCKVIDSQAFNLCKSLHEVTIPEGLEFINFEAFEGAGLTDLYLMAKDVCSLPRIYAMSAKGQGPSSFTRQRVSGNNTAPQTHAITAKSGDNSITNAEWDEVITWYQDELSGEGGLGTGNCLTMLHYADELKWFFEGIDMADFYSGSDDQPTYTTLDDLNTCVYGWHPATQEAGSSVPGWLDYWASDQDGNKLQGPQYDRYKNKLDGIQGRGPGMPQGLTDITAEEFMDHDYSKMVSLPTAYGIISGNDYVYIGPDKDGKYYPAQEDYSMRLAAGATDGMSSGQYASAWGWRQFPLATGIESSGEITYEKEYDNTWYTMCFPWRMDDNHLFYSFNQKCEIAEFVGVEMLNTDDPETDKVIEYSMIFHFDKTAPTYYMDADNVEYDREVEMENGEPRVNSAGNRYYIYTSKEDGTVVRAPNPWPASMKDATKEVREQAGKYLGIENVMVIAGRPYMIHPSIGANPGYPTKVYMTGIKKVELAEGQTYADLAEAQKVSKPVTTDGTFNSGESGTSIWYNPEDANQNVCTYHFWGNIDDYDVDATVKGKDMLDEDYPMAYYLGAEIDQYTGDDRNGKAVYPKYYKKTSGGVNKWSQYTAIIRPDANAVQWAEGLDGMEANNTGNGSNVVFGEWQQVTPDAIEEIIAEAEANNEEVKQVHLNVVFNVNGQVVRNNTTSVEGLPKGMYIVNGKKYMVK